MKLLTGLTYRSSEMEIIHACVTQVTQDTSMPYKENRAYFLFQFLSCTGGAAVISHCNT